MNDPRDPEIRARSEEIQTEPLFEAASEPKPAKPKRAFSSVAFGKCPICGGTKVGQIRDGAQLRWREHFRITTLGRRFLCRASGQPV